MPPSNHNFDPNHRGTNVRVVGCHVAMCSGLSGTQRKAVLTFSSGRQLLEPYLLNAMQVHALVRDLIEVLHSLERREDHFGGGTTVYDLPSPAVPAPPPRLSKGKRVRPSRSPSSPTTPIQATETWALHSILKNVESHDDFLRLIGAETPKEESDGGLAKKDSAPDPIEPPAVRKERKRRRRLPKTKGRKRK